jgi:hypothetical protein
VSFLVVLSVFWAAGALCGDSVLLVTEEEAARPRTRATVEELDDGPVISIVSPENGATLSGPFRLYIEVVKKEDGADILMDTLKVRYMTMIPIDITDRVRDYIQDTNLDVPDAEFPAGEHQAEIYIEDSKGNASSKLFRVKVVKTE